MSDNDKKQTAAFQLADYAANANEQDLPDAVIRESRRAFLNILGCMIGGSRHETVHVMKDAFAPYFGRDEATLVGLGARADVLHASYINCLSSSVDSFDDNHADMIIHPAGPAASVLLALAEKYPVTGRQLLLAFALGMEVICRLCRSVSVPPARANLAWVQTGITGAMGAAVAAAKLLRLDARQTMWAIGIANSQAAGFRGNHGTMCTPLMPAQAARCGIEAALLAQKNFTSADNSLEGKFGFCNVFSEAPNIDAITEGLGKKFDLLGITYKPFPSGVVLNPIIEAALLLQKENKIDPAAVSRIMVTAHPTAIAIVNRKNPADPMAAQLSLQHWTAAVLVTGKATGAELTMERISDPVVVRLREKVEAQADEGLIPDAAKIAVTLANGQVLEKKVDFCIGSGTRPMSDRDLEDKFRGQAEGLKSPAAIDELIDLCSRLDTLDDVRSILRAAA